MLPPGTAPGPSRRKGTGEGGSGIDADAAIRSTDDDAAASRYSAVSLGYLDDPFASILYRVLFNVAGPSSRKPPLINVGTHHRTQGIDRIVNSFLGAAGVDDGMGIQVVSLGAGSDTRFWRLRSQYPNLKLHYVEVDFPHLTAVKAQRIARSEALVSLLSASAPVATESAPTPLGKGYTLSRDDTQLSSELYTLLPLDLRSDPSASLDGDLLPLLDPSRPTLFLAECVFCYMSPENGRDVIQWFGSRFDSVVGVIYEMCGLDDMFGRVMKRNLASRNLSLPGAVYPTPQSQAERFLDTSPDGTSFDKCGGKSLWQVRESSIPPDELTRISKLEHLDEIEELKLVLSHYCIAWGSKGQGFDKVGL